MQRTCSNTTRADSLTAGMYGLLQDAIRQADAIPALLGLLKSALTRSASGDAKQSLPRPAPTSTSR